MIPPPKHPRPPPIASAGFCPRVHPRWPPPAPQCHPDAPAGPGRISVALSGPGSERVPAPFSEGAQESRAGVGECPFPRRRNWDSLECGPGGREERRFQAGGPGGFADSRALPFGPAGAMAAESVESAYCAVRGYSIQCGLFRKKRTRTGAPLVAAKRSNSMKNASPVSRGICQTVLP